MWYMITQYYSVNYLGHTGEGFVAASPLSPSLWSKPKNALGNRTEAPWKFGVSIDENSLKLKYKTTLMKMGA
jgi:hypothetical protein